MPVRQKIKRTQNATPEIPHGRDLFQTPNYAVDLIAPFIPKGITTIWECATGEGKIANRLRDYFGYDVLESDIRGDVFHSNFLLDGIPFELDMYHTAIITNPPFSLKREFYKRCDTIGLPFALLIPTDYCGWIIDAIMTGAEKIIPTRRIDYVTPTGLSGATGNTANFHSMWFTKRFGLGKSETFVELTKEMKENI